MVTAVIEMAGLYLRVLDVSRGVQLVLLDMAAEPRDVPMCRPSHRLDVVLSPG